MKRTNAGTRVVLKPRDLEIFKLLNRYRYLRSTFIHAFVGGKLNRFKERMGHLYHEGGYVNRPPQQWQFYNARYMPAIYENTEIAEELLEEQGLQGSQTTWLMRGRMGAHRQFAHSVMICDILASIELGIRETDNLRFIGWQEILARAPEATKKLQNPFSIPVNISHTFANGKTHSAKTAIIPDALFGIEYTTAGKKTYRWFAVEADRKTMPAFRSNLYETSFLKKILSYRDIRQNELYKSHCNWVDSSGVVDVYSFDHLRRLVAAWDGEQPAITPWQMVRQSLTDKAHGLVGEAAKRSEGMRRLLVERQHQAARTRLVDELGRLLISFEPDTDDLNGKFHRLMSERTATAERLRLTFARLGDYPRWESWHLRELREFRLTLSANQVKARLTGRELDAALADPRWQVLEGAVSP